MFLNSEIKKLKGYRPITYYKEGLLLIRGSNIYYSDINLDNLTHILKLPLFSNSFNKLSNLNLTSRLLRLNSSIGIIIKNDYLLLKTKVGFFLCDLINRNFIKENIQVAGNPFNFLFSNLRNSILIGDYTSNINKDICSIYERSLEGSWSKKFSFKRGSINHIHSIQEDLVNNCFYILTGDFGKAAAIWKADKDFNNVKKLSYHGQETRACWLIQDKNFIYYVSDRQDQINYLYRLKKDSSLSDKPETLFPVNGPSINMYKCKNQKFIFSTTVEPISINKNSFKSLFDKRLPPGVISKDVFLYYGNPKNGFKIIYRAKKDYLPPRLFQFGDIYFPTGTTKSNYIHFYEQGVNNCGIATVAFNLENFY